MKQQIESTGIELRVSDSLKRAGEITVNSPESLTRANGFLKGLKELRRDIDNHHDSLIEMAHKLHKEALAKKKSVTDPLLKAELIVKNRISAYLIEQRRKQAEEEEARRKAEEERKRLEQETIKKAQEAEEAGKKDEAEQILENAAIEEKNFEPIPIVQAAPKAEGLSVRQNWKFRVTDQALLCQKRPDLMIPDEVTIGKLVRIYKDKTDIPGVKVWSEDSVSVRL